jgi:hypothetical protein
MAALRGGLLFEAGIIEDSFNLIDDCIDRLAPIDGIFARVTTLIIVKSRNLAMGCYSLSLDGLAQESGALFRPLMETLEVLIYLAEDPSRAEEAVNRGLPKAGVIARCINGEFKALREHLSENASLVSLNFDALRHLVDWQGGRVKTVQPFNANVLRTNLHVLFAVLLRISAATVNCVSVAQHEIDSELVSRIEDIRSRGAQVINASAVGAQ